MLLELGKLQVSSNEEKIMVCKDYGLCYVEVTSVIIFHFSDELLA